MDNVVYFRPMEIEAVFTIMDRINSMDNLGDFHVTLGPGLLEFECLEATNDPNYQLNTIK